MEPTTALQVRELRLAAGMSQEDLAAKAGLGLRTIRRTESEVSGDVNVATLHAIARALGVTTGELFVAPIRERTARAPEVDVYPLQALVEPTPTPDGEVTLDQLRADARRAQALVLDDDYARAVPAVSAVLAQCRRMVEQTHSEAERDAVRELAVAAYDNASALLVLLGREDLALKAADAMEQVAVSAGNPVWNAWAACASAWPLIRQARFHEVIATTTAAAQPLEPTWRTREPMRLAMWAEMQCRTAAAAVRNNQPDLAAEALRQAAMAAAALPGDQAFGQRTQGTTRVATMRVEVAVAQGDFGSAARHIQSAPRRGMLLLNQHRYQLDVAHVALEHRKADKALDILCDLADVAPMWLPRQPYAHQVIDKLTATQKRKAAPRLRRLMRVMATPV